MKNKRKYKFTSGIQQITPDTVDYGKEGGAYEIMQEQAAKDKGLSQAAIALSGVYKPIGQVGGMAADVIRNRAKNKKTGLVAGGIVETGSAGAALGTMIAPGIGTAVGAGIGALYGGLKGAADYKKIKTAAQKAEEETRIANINKRYSEYTETDAQAALAKKGKYKVKSKKARMIETEGREPIFSPPDKNGKRKLLYYNPNDPTHEEGGVKAMVVPRADEGKKKLKAKNKPAEEPYVPLEDNDSLIEELAELADPTGISSYDDLYRSAHNLINKKKDRGVDDYVDLGLNVMGALPIVGKAGKLLKLGKTAFKYADKGIAARKIIQRAKQMEKAAAGPKTGNVLTRKLKEIRNSTFAQNTDRLGDAYNLTELAKENSFFENPEWKRTNSLENARSLGRRIFPKMSNENMYPLGAKQLKINDLNNTAFSNYLSNTPPANAANTFIQPQAGINQVARQIPQERRQEKIRTQRSHKTAPKDSNRIINPPMLYEMKPSPPRSTFNTKNDFNKGSKKVKVYK
jgi:hypothetical protein